MSILLYATAVLLLFIAVPDSEGRVGPTHFVFIAVLPLCGLILLALLCDPAALSLQQFFVDKFVVSLVLLVNFVEACARVRHNQECH